MAGVIEPIEPPHREPRQTRQAPYAPDQTSSIDQQTDQERQGVFSPCEREKEAVPRLNVRTAAIGKP